MKTWKQFAFTAIFLLIGGVFYVNAQDMIVLKDGNIIEAKVLEISPTEIRYKRFDHLDGPTIVIPATDVLSIRYENGTSEIISAAPSTRQESVQTENKITAIDSDKFIFGINANAGGAIGYAYDGGYGTGINIELGKGNFNSEINLMFPKDGFGVLFTFNGFWHGRIGGFYLGGGIGYIFRDEIHLHRLRDGSILHWDPSNIVTFGLNLGYKFVTKSGLYFRTGAYIGAGVDVYETDKLYSDWLFYIKPDLAIGWTVR